MQPDLQGQVAVVTGAGRGIGRAIAQALDACGATVVLAARSADELNTVAAKLKRPVVMPADVADEAQVVDLFERTVSRHGRLDVLVNNAGIGIYGPVMEFAADDFDQVMRVNLRGAFLCCREALKRMAPRGCGYIINLASVVGFRGYPEQAAYTASKHGVMGLTKSLAIEAQAHGIRVSAILPGGVDTQMVRRARPDLDRSILLEPADVAQSVVYLLSLSEKAAVDQIYLRRASGKPF